MYIRGAKRCRLLSATIAESRESKCSQPAVNGANSNEKDTIFPSLVGLDIDSTKKK